ncbi:MAG: hypothetical protein JWN99_1983 [Ilumatobacteraceae bacterium]|nr:hypothetical protein [Ilumatobacteraceae bacterium]
MADDQLGDVLQSVHIDDTAAYVNGERLLVRRVARELAGRGLSSDMIASKAYWRLDQANAAHGEPAKD